MVRAVVLEVLEPHALPPDALAELTEVERWRMALQTEDAHRTLLDGCRLPLAVPHRVRGRRARRAGHPRATRQEATSCSRYRYCSSQEFQGIEADRVTTGILFTNFG